MLKCNSRRFRNLIGGTCGCGTANLSNIIGGECNNICNSNFSLIGGGSYNYIKSNFPNFTYDSTLNNSILGGFQNCIINNNPVGSETKQLIDNVITGGRFNSVCNYHYAKACINGNFIGAGYCNKICITNVNDVLFNSIISGSNNVIRDYSNAHIIGSNLSATLNDYTFMNNLCVIGNVVKGGGSFSISHPNPAKTETHKLIHSFVESPTAGDNIYRYEVEVKNGVATIQLPDYYEYLNENTQIWVTAKNGCWNNKNFKFNKGDWEWCPINKGYDKQFECQKNITPNFVCYKINDNVKIKRVHN